MSEDSILHRALSIAAMALACVGGPIFLNPTAFPAPASLPPVAAMVPVEHSEEAFPAVAFYNTDQPPTGPEPAAKYRIRFAGPIPIEDVHLSIPTRFVSPTYIAGPKLASMDDQKPRIDITYQGALGTPRFVMAANWDDIDDKITSLFNEPVDLAAMGVTGIEITPVPTLKPLPQEKKSETAFGIPVEPYKDFLEAIVAILTIGGWVADQVKKRKELKGNENPAPVTNEYRVEKGSVTSVNLTGTRETVITQEDIGKSDDTERQFLLALVTAVRKRFSLWTAIYPQRETSPNPVINAEVEAKLDELQNLFCEDLTMLKRFIEKTGRLLAGFEAVEAVCKSE